MHSSEVAPQLEPRSSPRLHLNFLDGMRALAALHVACTHAFSGFHAESGWIRWDLLWKDTVFGRSSVILFLVLSGFCLMLPAVRREFVISEGTHRFFLRRAWRILPPYYFALVFALLIAYLFPIGRPTNLDFGNLFTHLVLIHNLFNAYDKAINPVFWTIAIEWQIYFLFPFFLFLWRKINPLLITLVVIFISTIIALVALRLIHTTASLHFAGLFVIGMLAATIATSQTDWAHNIRERFSPELFLSAFLVTGSICAFLLLVPDVGSRVSVTLLDTVIGASWAFLITALALSNQGTASFSLLRSTRQILEARWLVWLGAFSYSLYLLHEPILRAVRFCSRAVGIEIFSFWPSLLGVLVSIPISYGFYMLVEKKAHLQAQKIKSQSKSSA